MNRITFEKLLNERILVFDGAMGTALQKLGLSPNIHPEHYNISHPEFVESIHASYLAAGADIITTNTFGANGLKFENADALIEAGVSCAKRARESYYLSSGQSAKKWIALDVGPLGTLLEPLGTLTFDEAYDLFKAQVIAGVSAGVDLILIETITDLYEAKCAILAAVENCNLPVICTMSYEAHGRTFFGTDIASMATTLEGLGISAIGLNCSFGVDDMLPLIKTLLNETALPIIVQPNAGLPDIIGELTVYKSDLDHFSQISREFLELGVRGVGGCCGTDERHIEGLRNIVSGFDIEHQKSNRKPYSKTRVSSYSKVVSIGAHINIIGERLNPTGKKRLREALLSEAYDYVIGEAILQATEGADILDVNIGVPGIDEPTVMKRVVQSIQSVLDTPLQVDSSNVQALEVGARYYNGKPLINSVNGKRESLSLVLPIVKRYGACVIGLTLDDDGIPNLAEARFEIAVRIVDAALALGIPKENIIIDCLALTASAQQAEVVETLKAIRMVKEKLGVATALGVSNVSFGLPEREAINQSFLTMALSAGLDLPIINPGRPEMMAAIRAFEVLANIDSGAKHYISHYGSQKKIESLQVTDINPDDGLIHAIRNGLKNRAAEMTVLMLERNEPLEIVDNIVIPTLNQIGMDYESGTIFLPQLIQSAEAVKAAFEILKDSLSKRGQSEINRGKIILATVHHDIHDIGKNIVKVVMENYGYKVFDLGKDVSPEKVLETCKIHEVKLVGLSALMTTTVPGMTRTIELLRAELNDVKIVVGGAVLTESLASMVGADYYAKDAREMVKIAEAFYQG